MGLSPTAIRQSFPANKVLTGDMAQSSVIFDSCAEVPLLFSILFLLLRESQHQQSK